MTKKLAAVALVIGLTGCGGPPEASDSATENIQETAEVELFANGMPRYSNFDDTSLESTVTVVNTNQVEFDTGDTIEDVFDFYYAAMERDGLTVSSISIVGEPVAADGSANGGANITAQSRTDGTEVSVLIFDGSSNANPESNLTDGIPRYPGVAITGVSTEKAGDGRRDVLRFVTEDSPADILNFYRAAIGQRNMQILSMQTQMDGGTSTEYGNIYIREQLGRDGTNAILQTKGDRWDTQMQ